MAHDILREMSRTIRPSGFMDYRVYLDSLYQSLKSKHEHYTFQRMADDLGFGPTTVMHQIVRGYRPLSLKAAEKISRACGLETFERQYLVELVAYHNAKNTRERDEHFRKLLEFKSRTLPNEIDKAMLEYFSAWYHPVIREMVAMPGFRNDSTWIAKRLIPNIRPTQVEKSLALLESLGMIEFDTNTQSYRQSEARVSTGHRVRGMGLVSYHQQMIDLGREALTVIEGKRRNISAVTVCCDTDTANRLSAMVNTFQLQLLDEAEKCKTGDQVIQINIQLFPFTR